MRDGEIHLGELGRMVVPVTTIQRPSLDSFAWWVSQSSTLDGVGNARPLHSLSSITLEGVSRIPPSQSFVVAMNSSRSSSWSPALASLQ